MRRTSADRAAEAFELAAERFRVPAGTADGWLRATHRRGPALPDV